MSLPASTETTESVTKQTRVCCMEVRRAAKSTEHAQLDVIVMDEYLEDGDVVHKQSRRLTDAECDTVWNSTQGRTFRAWCDLINQNAT